MGLDRTRRISFREYSVRCIRKIWVDWPGMGLPIFPNPCFGPDELGLCLGCFGGTRAWRGAHCAFGLTSGILGLFLYLYQFYLFIYLFFKLSLSHKNTNCGPSKSLKAARVGYKSQKHDSRKREITVVGLQISATL